MKLKFTSLLATLALMGGVSYGQAFTEDFESVTTPSLPAGWTETTQATTGWKTHSGAITSTNGWVMSAHTKYAALDDWNNDENNNTSRLITPSIDLTSLNAPFLNFEYYFVKAQYNGGAAEELKVRISTDAGTTWTDLKTLDGVSDKWQKSFIDLSAYKTQSAVLIAFEYNDNGAKLIGAGIDDIKVYDPPQNELELTDVTPVAGSPLAYGVINSSLNIGGSVFNNGSAAVTSFKVYFQEGANTPVSSTVSGVNIAPFTSYDFTASNPFNVPASLGDYNLKVWVELTGDANINNDSGNTTVVAASFMPKKRIFIEEGTGPWCGWCPRGHVYMDSAHKTYPNSFSLVAVQNGSGNPMKIASYDSYLTANYIGGFPGMVVDREYETDPSDMIDVYNERKDYFGFADITLTDVAATGFDYSVKVSVKPAVDLTGDYRLVLVVTEDDVHAPGNSAYDQANYYSSTQANIPLKGAGLNWQQEASKVPSSKMYYQHVARLVYPSPTGAPGSLPSTMTAGSTYDYTINATIPAGLNRDKMHAIVVLLRNSDGLALNSQNITVPVGIQDATTTGINQLNIFPNPAASDVNVAVNLAKASSVSVQMFDVMGRLVSEIPAQDMTAGENKIQINTANLSAGVYSVRVQTETGSVSKQLSVIK